LFRKIWNEIHHEKDASKNDPVEASLNDRSNISKESEPLLIKSSHISIAKCITYRFEESMIPELKLIKLLLVPIPESYSDSESGKSKNNLQNWTFRTSYVPCTASGSSGIIGKKIMAAGPHSIPQFPPQFPLTNPVSLRLHLGPAPRELSRGTLVIEIISLYGSTGSQWTNLNEIMTFFEDLVAGPD
jgi:hypothetical protein